AGLDREVSETSLANVVWDESAGDPDPIPPGWAMGTAQQITDWQDEIDGARETYNIFASMAGWDSYDNLGSTMRTVNNDPGINCPNALWNGTSTNYCTGVTGDDVVAHEWGHAYTNYTNNLVYAWQSGALSESYSDIWGEVVDLLNGRGTDTPGGLRSDGGCSIYGQGTPSVDDSYRWLLGEDAPAFGGAIRDQWNPVCYGDPGKVSDTEYWCTSGDTGGVHTNSGVPNHAFALMVDGGTYNALTVTGIGLTKASHIEWAAQNMLTNASDFVDNADALEAACTALTGIDLPALSTSNPTPGLSGDVIVAADCQEVSDAIAATELRTPPDQCAFEPAWTAVTPLCEGQGTGQVNTIEYQDWETGQGNWITGTHDIANPDSFDNPDWVVRGALPDRAGDAMYVEDSINRGACTPADTVAGALNLDSPAIVIPAGALVPRVAIDHYVSTETGWDGGNLKVSVNDGPWVVVPDIAMEYNGYFAPGAINGGANDNPLGGEEGWTGGGEGAVATGWGQTQVNLLGLAGPGDTIELRFDMGLDGCNGVDGWYVDEVEVYSCTDEELPICGDGILDLGESCDDGNSADGDGCSSICQVEDGWICSDPTLPDPNGTNIVADWSFEGGVPNADWTATSTFDGIPGFPLCGPGNSCPAAGLASTGVWNVWIGGLSGGVTSSVSQTVNIPATSTDLTVQTLRGICDDASDTLVVSLDGSDIGTVVCDATDGDFVEQTFSVTGYNDDAAHNLYIGGTVGGTNGTHTNFFVDDVSINDNVPTAGTPSICNKVVEDLACNGGTIGFDTGIPSTWTVVDNESTGLVWTSTGIQGYPDDCGEGNTTNGSGEAACASSDSFGPAEFDTELWSNPFSLSSSDSASLDYAAYYDNYGGLDFFDLDISTDGGITWTNLLSWNEDHGAEDVSIDLSAYAGMSDLILRWRYYDPNVEDWDWSAQVDDVSLSCVIPDISLEKTVGLDPTTCATTDSISVPAGGGGTTVYYCYEATNTGTITVTNHSLVDSELGPLVMGLDYPLGPGETVNNVAMSYTISATITATTVNTATWTAMAPAGAQASASSSATVTVLPPTSVSLSSFEEAAPMSMTPIWLAAMLLIILAGAGLTLRRKSIK
ncbi:MAG: M4 family metallopeptidase, partial [Candidatus Promineifilaceae bacterium]